MAKPVISTVTVTWAAGDSLSSVIDCTTTSAVFVLVPHNWTPAPITFQISMDGTTFYDAVDASGKDFQVMAIPGAAVVVDPSWSGTVAYLKVRSGNRLGEMPQAQAVTMMVAMQ